MRGELMQRLHAVPRAVDADMRAVLEELDQQFSDGVVILDNEYGRVAHTIAGLMLFEFDADLLHDFDRAVQREWIETNGVGGWASSTIVCANTRRYHGLLVTGSKGRSERWVLVSKLDETLVVDGHRYELGCNRYPGVVSPLGFEWMTSFRRELFPEFTYEAG